MRSLVALALLCLAPSAWASSGPMDEKEMEGLANLIAHGEITEVVCAGEPEFDGLKTYTPYLATLAIDEVQKGEDLTSVTLPFATKVYEPDAALPKCDWEPYYEAGFTTAEEAAIEEETQAVAALFGYESGTLLADYPLAT